MTIVLDTNVVVSGLINRGGNPGKVLALALAGAVKVCVSPRILEEYRDVLGRSRFRFDQFLVKDILAKLDRDGVHVRGEDSVALGLPDVDDEPFLAAALKLSADYLVTGNLSDYPPELRRGCRVISPTEFIDRWK